MFIFHWFLHVFGQKKHNETSPPSGLGETHGLQTDIQHRQDRQQIHQQRQGLEVEGTRHADIHHREKVHENITHLKIGYTP